MTADLPDRLREAADKLDGMFVDNGNGVASHMREAADEIDTLRRWKREAMVVGAEWDRVFNMVTPKPGDLGRFQWDIVADEINRLLDSERRWKSVAEARFDEINYLKAQLNDA